VAIYLEETRHIGGLGMLGVVLAGALVGALIGLLVLLVSSLAARGVVRMLTASAGIPQGASFAYQESLVVRGRFEEAADAYRAHLVDHPADHDARLALAALSAGHLGDPAAAERLYLEVRAAQPSDRQEWVVAQALIELYHATGQRGHEMAELSRVAARYPGTAQGAAAKRVLMEMKGQSEG
jgi:thioredoxin-like negative regulator of GroEL